MPADETFLGSLTAADRDALLAVTRERALASGVSLFRHGDPGSSFAVLLAGRFKVVSRAGTGRNVLLGLRGPGDLVGEIAILDKGPRTADVVAVEAARVAIGSADALRRVLAERPSAVLALAGSLNRRLREADEGRVELAALTGKKSPDRERVQAGVRGGRPPGLVPIMPLCARRAIGPARFGELSR